MGRPRSDQAHDAALRAAASLLLERGVEGFTIDEVVRTSGVAKTTIYRHWASRQELVVAAVGSFSQPVATPNSGCLRDDLLECFADLARPASQERLVRLLPCLLDAANRDAELGRLYREFLEERRRPIRTVLQLAQLRGELPPTLDLDLVVDLLFGPMLHRCLLRRETVSPPQLASIVDCVLAGVATHLPVQT